MPKGGQCRFCSLPEHVREPAIERWRRGEAGTPTIAKDLRAGGYPLSAQMVNNCLNGAQHHGPKVGDKAKTDALGTIAKLLENSGIDPADIAKVDKVRINEYQALTKDKDGEAHIHDLKAGSILLTPHWAAGPQWPVVQPCKPTVVSDPKPPKKRKGKWKTAVILPDVQIGYRRDIENDALDPFHSESAMSAALRVVKAVDPDLVVHLGDLLDFAPFGTFEQEAGFSNTVQPAIHRAGRWLTEVEAASNNARQVLIEGNHDRRLQKSIVKNSLAAFGIKRAEKPQEWPVLSVPYLLRMDERNAEYVGGYPAGIYWLNDRLACIHGHKVRSAGNTAAAVVDDERISVIFGHVHRIELQHKTRAVRYGNRRSLAASPGCLCRIDGAVPSTKGSTDPLGRPIPSAENWQQGLAVVTYQEGDAPFSLELVDIQDGEVFFRGVPT